ncbi:MAG: hypothetical protein Q8L22_30075 [Reyranella sp.]|nr:hypothetical protein [Reyranella sp.]
MSPRLKNILLVFASVVLCLVAAEAIVRVLDGYSMGTLRLNTPTGPASVGAELVDRIPRAAGVERAWFFADPPPLPNRRPVPEEWTRLYRSIQDKDPGLLDFRAADMFKAWNAVFASDPCTSRHLRGAPGRLFLNDPADGKPTPPYRFLADATLPSGLVTNQIGWRGAPIETPRGTRTVRIVFVGASTTVDAHFQPFSWPEFVGYWLNRWVEAKQLPVRFEVLNAGREGISSPDIAAVVRTEVLPLRPDLVVYYEGANQFRLASVIEDVAKVTANGPAQTAAAQSGASLAWLPNAARYSALAGRVEAAVGAAVGAATSTGDGREPPKPTYRLAWPAGLDEQDPDLAHPHLPVSLNEIQRDLDRIRADLAGIGSELALSSFFWLVKDGLALDPIRHKYILQQLNAANHPTRYRDLERLAAFQNRVFAKYARTHGLAFIDIAGATPFEPDLFVDAIHTNPAGSRVRGWVVFNQLLPIIEKHLADDAWPRPWPPGAPSPLPTFTPREITFTCR